MGNSDRGTTYNYTSSRVDGTPKKLGLKVGDVIGFRVRGSKDQVVGLRVGTRLRVEVQSFGE